jgi:4-amino-4-deoxy-L-arabinose transferase-like glycosyltransferase
VDISTFAIRNSQFAILACFIVLALAYGLVVPPFENLDEFEHFGVVRHIAETGRLPVHGDPAGEVYHYRQEASQPPLYHLLSAGLVRLLGLQADDAAAFLRLNPWVACGPGAASLYDNRAVLYHDPGREAFPWQGALLTLHVLRAWSTLLQATTVVGTYALARAAFPRRREIAPLATAVVAFNPQFLLVASGVNNDNLITPLVTLGLYLLFKAWRDGLTVRRTVCLGLLIGLAGLSKLSGWLLLVLSAVIILILARRLQTRKLLLFIGHCSWAILAASAVSFWWFWRNWQLYGDPTALQPMLALVGAQGSPAHPLSALGLMFRSFWGQIPCSFYPLGFYAFYAAFAVAACSGLVWGWRRLAQTERSAVIVLVGWFLLVMAGWMRWDAMTPAPGGRLLFPALPAVALLMALGVRGLIGEWFEWGRIVLICLLAALALWTAARILPGFFDPPPRYADPSAVHPDHPLDVKLGDAVRLLGYDVALDERDPTLDLTLYWQVLDSMAEDYVLAVQLVSPVPGDTALRWNYNSWPGHGNYPTSAWQPGEVIADGYRFYLPEADFPTQAWDLNLVLYQEQTRERLDVETGGNISDRLVLTRLRVPGRLLHCPEEDRLTSEVRFADAVALTHASAAPIQDGTRVVLCWQALQPLSTDYTVFVHLQDASGVLIDTGDGLPMQGAFPTSMWYPGDVVLDTHHLTQTVSTGQRISVGLYELADGSRLPAHVEGRSLPDGAVSLWPDRP